MKTYMITNTQVLEVRVNEDGSLFISRDGINSIENAGFFIRSNGGIEQIVKRLVESDMDIQSLREKIEAERKAEKEAKAAQFMAWNAAHKDDARNEYEALVSGGVAESTEENIAVVLRYFNSMNWGMWPALPKMTVGYTINQYNIGGGRTATAMKLNDGRQFCVGAGPRDLSNYTHLR